MTHTKPQLITLRNHLVTVGRSLFCFQPIAPVEWLISSTIYQDWANRQKKLGSRRKNPVRDFCCEDLKSLVVVCSKSDAPRTEFCCLQQNSWWISRSTISNCYWGLKFCVDLKAHCHWGSCAVTAKSAVKRV
jgi:hypothetical protein